MIKRYVQDVCDILDKIRRDRALLSFEDKAYRFEKIKKNLVGSLINQYLGHTHAH
jgi:hypothetical protein